MICLNLFSSILMYNYSLWRFEESFVLPNHTLTEFLIVFFMFPPIILIFLSNYPKRWVVQIAYITFWVFMFSWTEYIAIRFGLTTYHNDWDFYWSLLFNCVMFPILRLHHSRPLWAWLLGIPITAFILVYFNFSLENMK
ncbi:CBO0543 family protein [Virgibacillus necropolis]|uniref:CBO0543 family protein n=1 Tax=Virgibacillus necropolis TaxID=163877 RepID=UPI00384EE562